MSKLNGLMKILFLGGLFCIVSGLTGWLTLIVLTSGGEILVPDILNKDIVSALKTLQEQKLFGMIDGEETHPDIPRGYIIRQFPVAGEVKKQYSTVKLVLSTGPDRLVMNDMRGYGIRQARIESSQIGLGTVTETVIHHPEISSGSVIAHVPAPGEIIIPGSSIQFLVSSGREPPVYRMPDLIGQRIDTALTRFPPGFNPEIRKVQSEGIEPDTIIAQKPLPGELLPDADRVLFDVVQKTDSGFETMAVFSYRVPEGLIKKHLIIRLISDDSERSLYDKNVDPSEEVRLFVPKTGKSRLEVWLDGVSVQTQTW